jgi:hypothetical protein
MTCNGLVLARAIEWRWFVNMPNIMGKGQLSRCTLHCLPMEDAFPPGATVLLYSDSEDEMPIEMSPGMGDPDIVRTSMYLSGKVTLTGVHPP